MAWSQRMAALSPSAVAYRGVAADLSTAPRMGMVIKKTSGTPWQFENPMKMVTFNGNIYEYMLDFPWPGWITSTLLSFNMGKISILKKVTHPSEFVFSIAMWVTMCWGTRVPNFDPIPSNTHGE